MMTEPLPPIVKTIDVPCDQARAFEIFVSGLPGWWPVEQRSMSLMWNGGRPAAELRVEPRKGGRITEISPDGDEYHWATITVYDPYDRLKMDFHMGLSPETASLVEVDFHALDDRRTRVVLTQSRWEAFGDLAADMYGGYGSSWAMIFEEGYGAACAASVQ